MKIYPLNFAIIFIFSLSCGKDDPNSATNKLLGKWNWVSSTGGFSGGITTPSSAGYNQTIEFSSPHNYIVKKDNVVINQGVYNHLFAECIHSGDSTSQLQFDNDIIPNSTYEFKGNDTLILHEECADCYRKVYVRIL